MAKTLTQPNGSSIQFLPDPGAKVGIIDTTTTVRWDADQVIFTGSCTATMPDIPIGATFTAHKAHAGAVNTLLPPSGSTFTTALLPSLTLTSDGDFWTVKRVTATRFDLVDGFESGETIVGAVYRKWSRFENGDQEYRYVDSSFDFAGMARAGSTTAPYAHAIYNLNIQIDNIKSFLDTSTMLIKANIIRTGASLSMYLSMAPISATSIRGYAISSFDYSTQTDGYLSIDISGRWY